VTPIVSGFLVQCCPPVGTAKKATVENGVAWGAYPDKVTFEAGVEGIGLSTIEATGEVYNLRDLRPCSGPYGQARYGFAIGTASMGDRWLQNEAGVSMTPEGETDGADAQPRGRRRRHRDAPVSARTSPPSARVRGLLTGRARHCAQRAQLARR